MRELKTKDEINKYIDNSKFSFFGLGVYSFNRLYLNDLENNYKILGLKSSKRKGERNKNILVELEDVADISNEKRNSTTLLRNPKTVEELNKFSHVCLLTYKGNKELDDFASEKSYRIFDNDPEFTKVIENKTKFREFITENNLGLYIPKYNKFNIKNLSFDTLQNEFNRLNKFVLQVPDSGGGKGTFFIETEENLDSAKFAIADKYENTIEEVIVSEYFEGIPCSTSGVATKWGTFSSNLQVQINDIRELKTSTRNGVFMGHDWSWGEKHINEKINKQARDITKEIGDLLYKKGYKGFFGLDFLFSKDNGIKLIECNPRFTGALPLLDHIQEMNEEPTFISLHILEFLSDMEDFSVNYNSIQKELISKPRIGAHFFVSSDNDTNSHIFVDLFEGTYELINNDLAYISDNIHIKNLKDNQFIIVEIPKDGTIFVESRRLLRVVTKNAVLNSDASYIRKDIKEIISKIRGKISYEKSSDNKT